MLLDFQLRSKLMVRRQPPTTRSAFTFKFRNLLASRCFYFQAAREHP